MQNNAVLEGLMATMRSRHLKTALRVGLATLACLTLAVVTEINYPLPTTASVQAFTFASRTARYVRVQGTTLSTIPSESNRYRMQFAEIEVY